MALSATSKLALVAMRISSASRANAKLAIVAMRTSSSSMNPSSERMTGGSGISTGAWGCVVCGGGSSGVVLAAAVVSPSSDTESK